ncbi:MAG: transposase [Bacteroidia bacterium]|nr:transposase [Bacteroidia bacterium]
MSRKYKFYNKEGLYFISFAVINWIDVFIRLEYQNIFIESLKYCQKEKGLELYCWCLMPSHAHLIFRAKNNNPTDVLRDFKTFTSKAIQMAILENPKESRREWMLSMMETAGAKNSNVEKRQFWQQNNHPIELWSAEIIEQKVNYIHKNPVVAGFVNEPWEWKLSSAANFAGQLGLIDIEEL